MTDRKLLKLAKKANEALREWKATLAESGFDSDEEKLAYAKYTKRQVKFDSVFRDRPNWRKRK